VAPSRPNTAIAKLPLVALPPTSSTDSVNGTDKVTREAPDTHISRPRVAISVNSPVVGAVPPMLDESRSASNATVPFHVAPASGVLAAVTMSANDGPTTSHGPGTSHDNPLVLEEANRMLAAMPSSGAVSSSVRFIADQSMVAEAETACAAETADKAAPDTSNPRSTCRAIDIEILLKPASMAVCGHSGSILRGHPPP